MALPQRRSNVTIGGSWMREPRPCSDCGKPHQHLTDMADGRHICIPCWFQPVSPHVAKQIAED